MSNEIVVSVRLMAYNHAKFIEQALDGIYMQRTNFKVEIVVGDDFSSDNTLQVVALYDNSDNISLKILKREKGDDYDIKRQKFGRLYNFSNILANCSGKYIALLDGDDYWTDPLKLQKQVDFLEQNPQFILSCHNFKTDPSDKGFKLQRNFDHSFSFSDTLRIKQGATLSTMFRNILREKPLPESFHNVMNGDWALELFLLAHGEGYYHKDAMGVYRLHEGSVSQTKEFRQKAERLKVKYALSLIPEAPSKTFAILRFVYRNMRSLF